jgi:hypothetical protein
LILLLVWGPSVVAILKRHYIWGAVGLLVFAPIGWIGALLLAKPESWWARKRYGDAKRAKAIEKYGDPAEAGRPVPAAVVAPAAALGGADSAGDWECKICGEVSATRVAAESHVRGAHPQAPVESSIGQAPES